MSKKNHSLQAPWVWIDLEMTGLNPKQDHILEIACVITDPQLSVIATMDSITIACPQELLQIMDPHVQALHTQSGLLKRVIEATTDLAQAEQQVIAFMRQHAIRGESLLCGNSIWQDKFFLLEHMPQVVAYLHYRIVDVSTVKILINSWYAGDSRLPFPKQNKHRALDDIQESIAELQFYRKFMV